MELGLERGSNHSKPLTLELCPPPSDPLPPLKPHLLKVLLSSKAAPPAMAQVHSLVPKP